MCGDSNNSSIFRKKSKVCVQLEKREREREIERKSF